MNSPRLDPCPFCGMEDRVGFHTASATHVWVICRDCEAEGPPGGSKEEAAEAWNVRLGVGADE